ncbi:MAG: putative sporulation hydrolase CotR [Candidatus Anoxychlamydiales bacterium]|nr:putative sporulation hydrolase CotR [Candidatus Anoxychlamydiales bacterium]
MKKILSINGGGIKGTFAAAFLASIEDTLKSPVADYFDLIVGSSTGGIIALGLGLGLSGNDILNFYRQEGPNIFAVNNISKYFRWIFTSKFDDQPLKQALHKSFEDKKLGDSKKRLIIPSLSLETGDLYLYKTAHHPRLEFDYKVKAVDVALATSAAPTYFPIHQIKGTPFIDGGVWANNPTDIAIIEAISVLNWNKSEIKVLNLGCTYSPFDVEKLRKSKKNKYSGIFQWAKGRKLLKVFMESQEKASLAKGQLLVGKENVFHINPVVPEGRYSLDNATEIESLIGLGQEKAREAFPDLKNAFFQIKADDFVPYKTLR